METKYEDIATALKMRGYRVREFTKAELERGRTVPALKSGLLEICDRCEIAIDPNGTHYCEDCGKKV